MHLAPQTNEREGVVIGVDHRPAAKKSHDVETTGSEDKPEAALANPRWLVQLPELFGGALAEQIVSLRRQNLSTVGVEQEQIIQVGSRVRVVGMEFNADYNFREGTVVNMDADDTLAAYSGQFEVQLDDFRFTLTEDYLSSFVYFKRENLTTVGVSTL